MGAVVLSGAGIAASTLIKSPAQAAADAGAPERDVLTAPVEYRVLKESVIVRGLVAADRTVTVSPSASSAEGATAVVTKLPVEAGDKVKAGQVLVEISGRPVFVLRGSLPAYRDLKPGAKGDDVKQLQRALSDLGFGSGTDTSGEFGAGTQSALASFYTSIGYEPQPVSQDGASQVESATKAVTQADRALQDVRADSDADATDEARAEEDLATAQQTLTDARLQAGAMLPAAETVVLDSFPARVESVPVRVGDKAVSKVMTVSSGALAVQATLTPSQKSVVRTGQSVRVLSEATGDEFDGMVASIADPETADAAAEGDGEEGSEDSGASGVFYTMTVKPDDTIPVELAGQDVRLTVEAANSKGKVLVVPYSAVSAAADGSTVVTVLEASGDRRRVKVRAGLSGDGYVEVTPAADGALAKSDKVIVGSGNTAAGEEDGVS
ncbi:peptidoglycan-binding protein [Streptomyces sp. SD15]